MWKLPDGAIISKPRDVTISGVLYPASMFYVWSIPEMNALDIYPYREVQYNGEYYTSTGVTEEIVAGEVVATHSVEPKYTVSGVREVKKDQAKMMAWEILHPFDWYVIRKYEVDVAIPTDVENYRSSIRSAVVTVESDVTSITDYAELVAYNIELPTYSG